MKINDSTKVPIKTEHLLKESYKELLNDLCSFTSKRKL